MNANKTTAVNDMESQDHKITGVPEGPVQMLLERQKKHNEVCLHSAQLQDKQNVTHDSQVSCRERHR